MARLTKKSTAFALKPSDVEIPGLIERYNRIDQSNEIGDRDCLAAGKRIRDGDFSINNLRVIYRWKMASRRYLGQEEKYFDKNSDRTVSRALRRTIECVEERDVEQAFKDLQSLKGVAIAVSSAILMAIFPEQFTIIDVMALRAFGVSEKTPLTVPLYVEYQDQCSGHSGRLGVSLRDFDRALWQWGHEHPVGGRESAGC